MNEKKILEFKFACKEYFSTIRLSTLACYGRFLQLKAPTAMKKADLIQQIIGVLCGEINPKRNNRGAPIKGDYIDQSIFENVEHLQKQYLYQASLTSENPDHSLHLKPAGDQPQEPPFLSLDTEENNATSIQCIIQISKLNKEQKNFLSTF